MAAKKKFSLTQIEGWFCHRPIVVEQHDIGTDYLLCATIDDGDPIEVRSPRSDGEAVAVNRLKEEIKKAAGTTHKTSIRAHLRDQKEEDKFVENARRQAELNRPR